MEALARLYLVARGLETLAANYTTRLGELDLVMLDRRQGEIAFVEVRYRRSHAFGRPGETVTAAKQARLVRAAELFLAAHGRYDSLPARFDVVSISTPNYLPRIEWIRDAFQR